MQNYLIAETAVYEKRKCIYGKGNKVWNEY